MSALLRAGIMARFVVFVRGDLVILLQACYKMASAQAHSFEVVEAAAEEAFADGAEAQRDVADAVAVVSAVAVWALPQEAGGGKRLGGVFGGGGGGIDQREARGFFPQERFEQRVVGAAEDECVGVVGEDGFQVFAHGEAGDVVLQPAFFHERHQERAGL